ncbi:FAD-dependent oxidoreductase (plasmid) [Bradyrhizobium sp. 62B]|uniref:NAD(P)/FAD-dependent oxidoreductase n=1 Tax=Bradyrhizobium sp. 62B TaxID=2898442 RepID=UPI002557DEC2|nr:FAD-dependent oxidoreductase [Bradyrhizobium sp. 62B]
MSNEATMMIVGAGIAGSVAAQSLRAEGWRGRVVLIGHEAMLPYERPPLSKATLTEEVEPGPKTLMTSERLGELDIEYIQGREVVAIDRAAHIVRLADGGRLAYERLLLTTGARARPASNLIAQGTRITTLRTYDDALFIRRAIDQGSEVVVVGGGFIGLEVAASAVSRGASVTVIEAGPRLLARAVPAPLAELIKAKHERSGVRLEIGTTIERVDAIEGRSKVILTNGRAHLADLVIVGIGAVPNVELARTAGLAINNGIALDELLATSDPDIFGAGDCCSFPHRLYNERIRLEAWRSAQQQGAAAAANMLGANSPYEKIPWFWSDQYDQTLQVVGLHREQDIAVVRDLGPNGLVIFYLANDGRIVAACGFGSLPAIAREIRFAEMMIDRGLAPNVEALSTPATNLKSLLS